MDLVKIANILGEYRKEGINYRYVTEEDEEEGSRLIGLEIRFFISANGQIERGVAKTIAKKYRINFEMYSNPGPRNENSIINCPAFQDVCDYGDQLDLKIRNILSARKRLSSILEVIGQDLANRFI